MHRDPAGAGTLNTLLQEILAPARDNIPERQHGARVFRPGTRSSRSATTTQGEM